MKFFPTSVQMFFRPSLLIAVGLHGILLAIPLSQESRSLDAEAESKVEEQDAELPPSPLFEPSPQPQQQSTPKIASTPTPKPVIASPRRVQPSPQVARRTGLNLAARGQSRDRTPSQSSNRSPQISSPKVTKTKTPTPPRDSVPTFSSAAASSPQSPPQPENSPKPPEEPTPKTTVAEIADPFRQFPFYPFEKSLVGSLELHSSEGDRKIYAFNTRDEMEKVIEFYQREVPKNEFQPLTAKTDREDLKIYQVTPKNSASSQYLHLISFEDRIAILLLPEEITDVESLKQEARERLEAIELPRERLEKLELQRKRFRISSQLERILHRIKVRKFRETEE